jgi:outer membrane immunogenic protein
MLKVLRLLIAGTLFVIAGPAIAQTGGPGDGPVLPVLPVLEPVFSWTGGYAGVNVGYGWGTKTTHLSGVVGPGGAPSPVGFSGGNNRITIFVPQPWSVTSSSDVNGVIGGGQLGANWQAGIMVLGFEADAQASSRSKVSTYALPAMTSVTQDYSQPWFGTFRGRAGWAFADGWLVYATAGGAWLHSKDTPNNN